MPHPPPAELSGGDVNINSPRFNPQGTKLVHVDSGTTPFFLYLYRIAGVFRCAKLSFFFLLENCLNVYFAHELCVAKVESERRTDILIFNTRKSVFVLIINHKFRPTKYTWYSLCMYICSCRNAQYCITIVYFMSIFFY